MGNDPTKDIKDAEFVEETETNNDSTALAAPIGSLTDLSSRLDKGVEIIRARAQILEIARKAAIRMTSPEDFLLFKDKEGRVVGYLQDCGCDRVRDLFGISVFKVSHPEKVVQPDGSYTYIVTGSGKCSLTQQIIEGIEGGRSSTDDFITRANPPLSGAAMELAVRKAARANLDGNITRELSGLKSVPLEEIEAAYSGDSTKTRKRFREGRGFGAGSERSTQGEQAPDHVEAPKCPKCKVEMVLRKGTGKRGEYAFYGCPNFKSKDCKETIQESDWLEELAQRKPANGSGFTQAGEVAKAVAPAATFAPEIVRLGGLIAQLQQADKGLTADAVCKEFFTVDGTVYKYNDVKTWKNSRSLRLVAEACNEIEKKYSSVLPPKPTVDEDGEEELPL